MRQFMCQLLLIASHVCLSEADFQLKEAIAGFLFPV